MVKHYLYHLPKMINQWLIAAEIGAPTDAQGAMSASASCNRRDTLLGPRWLCGKESAVNAGRSPGEGNGNSLRCSCQGNPRDRGTWWAAIYGVAQSRTRLKQLSSSSSSSNQKLGNVEKVKMFSQFPEHNFVSWELF